MENEETTVWKSRKYSMHDINVDSFAYKKDFNYANIQLPTLEGFDDNPSQDNPEGVLTNVSGKGKDKDNDNPKDKPKNNYVDYSFIQSEDVMPTGLNAQETRVDRPLVLPEESDEPVPEPDESTDPIPGQDPDQVQVQRDIPNTGGDKLKRSISAKWKTFYRSKTVKNAKKLAVSVVENVPEMFAIPEMISKMIVKNATDKSKRKSIDYAQNVLKVNAHFKSFIAILLCLYITFNWWYLMLYTNHYIDFYKMLQLPMFLPMIWIIGPLTTPLAALNYYLLGKRTEPEFYKKNIEPVLKNKSFYLSMLFIATVVLYEPIIQMFTTNMKDILGESDKTNPLVGIVIGIAVLSFLYSVVFNTERNIQFISTVSFLIAIVSYLIMFILVIMLAKPVSFFVILYLVFYSFLFLLFAENFNFMGKIMEMMSDTTEQCLNNSSPSTVSKLMNVCYRYSFFILVFIVLFFRIAHALYDVQTITDERVRVSCYAIYLSILIVFMLLMGYNFIDVMMNVKQIITGESTTNTTDSNEDEFDKDDPDISLFGKIANAIRSFGEQLKLIVLILWEALKYIVIQIAGLLTSPFRLAYGQFMNIMSSMNTSVKPDTPLRPPLSGEDTSSKDM